MALIAVPVAVVAAILVIKLFERPMARTKQEVAVLMERTLAGDDHAWDDLISVPLADPELEAIRKQCLSIDPVSERQEVLVELVRKLRAA